MRSFQECYEYFEETSKAQVATSQTSEWLMDNFYVIEQAVRQVEEDFPANYYQRLPKTREGWTRIHIVATVNTQREDARLELDQIRHFLNIFQETTPLSTGELWALPLMLRLAVLDTLAAALAAVTQLKWHATSPSLVGMEQSAIDADPDLIVANSILNLRLLATQDWKSFFESTSVLEAILRRDPAGIIAEYQASQALTATTLSQRLPAMISALSSGAKP